MLPENAYDHHAGKTRIRTAEVMDGFCGIGFPFIRKDFTGAFFKSSRLRFCMGHKRSHAALLASGILAALLAGGFNMQLSAAEPAQGNQIKKQMLSDFFPASCSPMIAPFDSSTDPSSDVLPDSVIMPVSGIRTALSVRLQRAAGPVFMEQRSWTEWTPQPKEKTPQQDSGDSASSGKSGWKKSHLGWQYVQNGSPVIDAWIQMDRSWYHFDPIGYMQTGFWNLEKDGKSGTFYLDASGAMKTGWLSLEENGKPVWYFLDENGVLQTGWVQDPKTGTWYYLNHSGIMQTGWIPDQGNWYYLDRAGARAQGWKHLAKGSERYWYYFDENGILQKNTQIGEYELNSEGICING